MICAWIKVSRPTNQLRVAVDVSQLRTIEGCSLSLLTAPAVFFLLSCASYVIAIATIAASVPGTLPQDRSCRPLKLLRLSRFPDDPPRSASPHVPSTRQTSASRHSPSQSHRYLRAIFRPPPIKPRADPLLCCLTRDQTFIAQSTSLLQRIYLQYQPIRRW